MLLEIDEAKYSQHAEIGREKDITLPCNIFDHPNSEDMYPKRYPTATPIVISSWLKEPIMPVISGGDIETRYDGIIVPETPR